MDIHNHQLQTDNIHYRSSPNHGTPFKQGYPDSIILHYTDLDSATSAVELLCDPEKKVSAHLVVGRNGEIWQLVPFDHVAWHAGKSAYGGREGFNQYSIGIEIDNSGKLIKEGKRFISWLGTTYPKEEVVQAQHRNQSEHAYWHAYPPSQISLVKSICQLLIDTYGITSIYGHEEIAPSRKIDPGPAFPLDQLRNELLTR